MPFLPGTLGALETAILHGGQGQALLGQGGGVGRSVGGRQQTPAIGGGFSSGPAGKSRWSWEDGASDGQAGGRVPGRAA